MHGRSTAYEIHVLQLLESFPDLDPDFKEENIVEAIKRIEQEKETIKAEIKNSKRLYLRCKPNVSKLRNRFTSKVVPPPTYNYVPGAIIKLKMDVSYGNK
jgi:hypothetical protein